MSDKAAGQKARSPEGCDENGPAAALLLSHVSIQICSFLSPVRLGPPCRRPILIATPLPQSLTWCTRRKQAPPELPAFYRSREPDHVPVGKYRFGGLAGVKGIVLFVVYPRRFLQEVFARIGNKVWLVGSFGDLERGPRHRDPSASNSQNPADVDDSESHAARRRLNQQLIDSANVFVLEVFDLCSFHFGSAEEGRVMPIVLVVVLR